MEGLPEHLPEEGLHKQLKPVMAALGIPEDAYSCEKFRKRKWANVTFGEKHGRLFLQNHGEMFVAPKPPQARSAQRSRANGSVNSLLNTLSNPGVLGPPRRTPRLKLAGSDIFCKISKASKDPRAGPKKPNPITLRGLEYAAEEMVNPTQKRQTDGAPVVLDVHSLSCGHNVWDGDRLVFLPESEFEATGNAKFTKQALVIRLQSQHVIKIPLDTVVDLICSFRRALTLTLCEEPSFFIDTAELADQFDQLSLAQGLSQGLSERQDHAMRTRICDLDSRHAQVVGQCLVYQFQITGLDLNKQILALKHHDVLSSVFEWSDLMTQRTPPLHLGASRTSMKTLMAELADHTRNNTLPYGILFQLQALAWNAYLHPGSVIALTRKLHKLFDLDKAAGRQPISVDAMKKLFKQIDWPTPHGDRGAFEVSAIIDVLRDNEDKFSKDVALRQGSHSPSRNLALVHRVTVTPSRMTLHGPELEAKNRILRKFPDHHENFIRVQFCDENGLDLFLNPKINHDQIYDKFRRVLRDGIQIAGRTYSFLGFSHSSLRSHSAWVGCETHPDFLFYILTDAAHSFLPRSWTTTDAFKPTSPLLER